MTRPFLADPAKTVSITVTGSNQRVKLNDSGGIPEIRIYNDDTQTVFVAFGDVTVTASASTSVPVPSGAVEVLRANLSSGAPLYAAAIGTASNSRKIYFTPGHGI